MPILLHPHISVRDEKKRKEGFGKGLFVNGGSLTVGAREGTRTHTLTQQILSLPCLPIPSLLQDSILNTALSYYSLTDY